MERREGWILRRGRGIHRDRSGRHALSLLRRPGGHGSPGRPLPDHRDQPKEKLRPPPRRRFHGRIRRVHFYSQPAGRGQLLRAGPEPGPASRLPHDLEDPRTATLKVRWPASPAISGAARKPERAWKKSAPGYWPNASA